MDILDEGFGVTPESVPLESLIETRPLVSSVPEGAIRNRAATTALLSSEPSKMVDNYRLMVKEGQEGSDATYQQASQALDEHNRGKSMPSFISVLGDPSIPLDKKKAMMNQVQQNGFKEEPSVTLQTQALISPSEGESPRGEAARISLADTMKEMQVDREKRQKMVNTLVASHPDPSLKTVGELAESDVMPFGRNIIAANVAQDFSKQLGEDPSIGTWVKNFLLPGSTKADIQTKLMNVPPEKRQEVSEALITSIKNSATVFHNENYYAQYENAVRLLTSPQASDSEVWGENMMTIFDAFWVGGEAKGLSSIGKTPSVAEAASKARRPGSVPPGTQDVNPEDVIHKVSNWEVVPDPHNPFAPRIGEPKKALPAPNNDKDVLKRLELNSVVKTENPSSPFSIIEQANPQKAREIHTSIVNGSDELAQALTGVDREQAIINNVYPQIGTESGAVQYKVSQDVVDAVENTGATRFTENELGQAVDNVKRDFRAASNLQINDAMTTFKVDGDHIVVDAHYTAPDGSFQTAEEAKAQAKFSLRGYGLKDSEIQVMKRQGMDYVPVTGSGDGKGDFIIKVQTKHPIDNTNVSNFDKLDVKRNFFDRISWTVSEHGGSLSRTVFDPASMLHPTITGSSSIAIDQAVTLEGHILKPIKELRASIEQLDTLRRAKIEDYMREANLNGIRFDPVNLRGQGFLPNEIDHLRQWKQIWDNHYHLENLDMVRTLNNQGYQLFKNKGTTLYAKPIAKDQTIGKVYDPQQDKVITLSKQDMDTLYSLNGSVAKLRRTTNFAGDLADHMIVRNTPNEYLRKVRDSDAVLNYRHGYYTIYYKAPRFIEEAMVEGGRTVGWKAVGVAGTTEEADAFKAGLQSSTGKEYRVRGDTRGMRIEDDAYWDLNSANGRISQRYRGATLEDASGLNHVGDREYIANPMESAVRAAKSISGRTVNRTMLETAKERAVAQYGEFFPSDGMGGRKWPSSKGEISDRGNQYSSRVADARTTYEYINYLENGYINSVDEVFKAGMNMMADIAGGYHLSLAEKGFLAASKVGPSQLAKAIVFQAYIAGNPLRQWIIQPHQAIRTTAYNPIGWMNGNIPSLAAAYAAAKAELPFATSKYFTDFIKFVDDSGMVDGVDKNSLVRGMKLSMADSSSKIKRAVGTAVSIPQTVGFDIGEKANQLMHISAVYEKWVRKGANVADKTVRDKALIEARALSYEMNAAGDMPYSTSTPAMVLQFLQMTHKAWLQVTNRKIPWSVKGPMFALDMVLFGTPIATIGALIGKELLPDNPKEREEFVHGSEGLILNEFFSQMAGEKVGLDFDPLSPYDMQGWMKIWGSAVNDGALPALLNSPAGQMFAKDGGRVPNAMRMWARYFGAVDDMNDKPVDFITALNESAKIASGWNNALKAKILLENKKKFDSYGALVADHVNSYEAIAAAFGINLASERDLYNASQQMSNLQKDHKKELDKVYKDILRYYQTQYAEGNANIEQMTAVTGKLLSAFDSTDLSYIQKKWANDLGGREHGLFKQIMEASGYKDSGNLIDIIKTMPVPQEEKDKMIQRVHDIKALREQQKNRKQ